MAAQRLNSFWCNFVSAVRILSLQECTNFKAVWVEVENRIGKNYLLCCLYRHPSSDLDNFSECLHEVLSIPAVSNKQVFILGDFNVNLLNCHSHTETTNYVNFLFSKQFLPYIVHPSRVSKNLLLDH